MLPAGREEGSGYSCAQECWSLYHRTLAIFFEPPEELDAVHRLFDWLMPDTRAPQSVAAVRRALGLSFFARFAGILN